MQKYFICCSILFLLFLGNSCSSDNKDDVLWDFVNYNVEFNLEDSQLLNDDVFLSKIKVQYDNKDYVYSASNSYTKATYVYPLAIRLDKGLFVFGEFSPTSNLKNKTLEIDWGNGRVDKLSFSIYITWEKNDPTIHKTMIVNGVKHEEWLPIPISFR